MVSAVTQRAGAELVPSRPVFCLHPAPTATSRVPEAPHLGWRPLTGALTSVWLQVPHSPSWVRRAVVGIPLGCPLWSSLGGPGRTPARTLESRAEPDTLRTPACQRPGPRLRGRPRPSETVQGPRGRPRQDAPSAAGSEPGPRTPSQTPSMGSHPPPRSRVSPEQPRESLKP